MVSGRARSHREPGWRTARTGRWSGVQLFLSCRDFLELFWGGKSCHRLGESGMQHAGARSCLELLGNAVLFSYFHKLCNRHHNRLEHIFISLKRNPVLLSITPQCPPPPPSTWQPPVYVLSLQICLFWTFRISGIAHTIGGIWGPVSFGMFVRFIHSVAGDGTPFSLAG